MNRDHPSLAEYEARASAAAEGSIRHGATLEEAQAGYEADMEAETYADRWQAWAESREPEPEPELEAEAG
jgi:hypothetical protein